MDGGNGTFQVAMNEVEEKEKMKRCMEREKLTNL